MLFSQHPTRVGIPGGYHTWRQWEDLSNAETGADHFYGVVDRRESVERGSRGCPLNRTQIARVLVVHPSRLMIVWPRRSVC